MEHSEVLLKNRRSSMLRDLLWSFASKTGPIRSLSEYKIFIVKQGPGHNIL